MTSFSQSARTPRPFYFVVVVWGPRYTDFMLDYCIPSLLAPGNIPSLVGGSSNKFLIVTTPVDWDRMTATPIFEILRGHIEPVFIELPSRNSSASVYDYMTVGHKLATQMAFRDRAYGVLLAPDLMLSDGSMASIQRHATAGAEVVLAAALRYGEEPLFEGFRAAGIDLAARRNGADMGLSISGREMAGVGIQAFHSETLRFEWDAPYFTPYFTGLPGACWWRADSGSGVILHTASWTPLLVDYGAIHAHDESTMEHWVIDGDYVYRNFGSEGRIHVVQDSDDVMLVSWTPLAVGSLSLRRRWLLSLPHIGPFLKGCLLRDAFLGPVSDPLKRRIFMLPVYFHAKERNADWNRLEDIAGEILNRYLVTPRNGLHLWTMRSIGTLFRIYALVVGRWANRGHIMGMVGKSLSGDREARDYLRRRTKLYLRQLLGKSAGGD